MRALTDDSFISPRSWALAGLFTVAIAAANVFASESMPTNTKSVASVLGDVFQIKIATDANSPKAAYGSCFVVDTAGILATNFHVVAYALHDPKKYHLYLIDGDRSIPAEVVAIDAVNDLALVQVDRTFNRAVKFAHGLPESGDKIYSIGWPEDLNKAVSEGNFNGLMQAGPYRKIQMSIPLNPGMSGGPTINDAGEVIGVNVSLRADSQSLAFAIPYELLRTLMREKKASLSRPEDHDDFDEVMRAQLERVQEEIATSVLKESDATLQIGGWNIFKPAKIVKCWHSQESGPRDQTHVITEQCYLSGSMPIKRDLDAGTFRLRYQAIENRSLSAWQFLHQLNEELEDQPFDIADKVEKFTTSLRCRQLDIVNPKNVGLRVHYCINGFVPYAEAYNLEFELVASSAQRTALLVSGSFLGFSAHNALAILRTIINSITLDHR